jgi:hypothetical protein
MTFYRAFFSVSGHIISRQEFHAESDEVAVQAAEKVADACSEACEELQIWDGARLVASVTAPTPDSLIGKSRKLFAMAREARILGRKASAQKEEASKNHKEISARAIEVIEGLALNIEQALHSGDLRFRESPRLQTKLAELSRPDLAAD